MTDYPLGGPRGHRGRVRQQAKAFGALVARRTRIVAALDSCHRAGMAWVPTQELCAVLGRDAGGLRKDLNGLLALTPPGVECRRVGHAKHWQNT